MENILLFFLIFIAVQNFSSCTLEFGDSKDFYLTEPLEKDKAEPTNLSYTAGNIISCQNNQTFKGFWDSNCLSSESSHIFLASSNSTVIYARQTGDTSSIIVEESLFQAIRGKAEHCKVVTHMFGNWVRNSCHQRRYYTVVSVETAIRRARDSIQTCKRQKAYYDATSCNSQHWVSSWKYNIAFALTIEPDKNGRLVSVNTEIASDACEAPGEKTCPWCGVTDW